MSNRGRHHKKKKDWIYDILTEEEIQWLLSGQKWAGNPPNIEVFKEDPYASARNGGFCFAEYDLYKSTKNCTYQIADKIHNYKQIRAFGMLNINI